MGGDGAAHDSGTEDSDLLDVSAHDHSPDCEKYEQSFIIVDVLELPVNTSFELVFHLAYILAH